MKHTPKEIEEIVKKFLEDIQSDYFDDVPFETVILKNIKKSYTCNIDIALAWRVFVEVEYDYRPGNRENCADLIITIDDATGEIEGYLDGSGGRPIPCYARLDEDGIYRLSAIKNA